MATIFRRCPLAFAAVLLCALPLACASGGGPVKPASPSRAMVYGHLELPDSVREQIQWIHVYELGTVYVPPFKTPPNVRFFPNGDFFVEDVAPGEYYVHHLVAGFEAFYLYPPDMSEGKQLILDRAVEVKAGEVAYLGSHRIHGWKPGLQSKMSPQVGNVRFLSSTPGAGPEPIPNFLDRTSFMTAGSGTFSLDHTRKSRDEQRVLKHVLQDVAGTGWDTRIQARLRALR